MENVLRRLLDGVRRLHNQWQEDALKAEAEAEGKEKTKDQRQAAYRRCMQVLSRFETCFRRASWKSGSEMVFPMLFGHMAFMTHRCWTVYMKHATWLAAEAWRQAYGQVATQGATATQSTASVQYKLPQGATVTLDGWREERRGDATVYVGPDGQEGGSVQYAYEAMSSDKKGGDAALRAMSRLVHDFQQGFDEEGGEQRPTAPESSSAAEAPEKPKAYRTFSISQLDDYLHRGGHPIVKHLSLYVYSMWVYRVEANPFQASDASARVPSKPRSVDMPFDEWYPARATWIQRLASEPRVPLVDGMQFVADDDASMEMHCMMKAILFTPIYLAHEGDNHETRQQRLVRTFMQLCVAPPGCTAWPATRSGPNSQGPFERAWERSFSAQQNLLRSARDRDIQMLRMPSLWHTCEVQTELDQLQARLEATEQEARSDDNEDGSLHAQRQWRHRLSEARLLSVEEYSAVENVRSASHFVGIARARSEKPRRQLEQDRQIVEEPLMREGQAADADGDEEMAGEHEKARLGLSEIGQSVRIACHFDDEQLQRIIAFDTAGRANAFVKELMDVDMMHSTALPAPSSIAAAAKRREDCVESLQLPYQGLAELDLLRLKDTWAH